MIHYIKDNKKRKFFLKLSFVLFFLYIFLLVYLLFFGFYRQQVTVRDYNVIPFRTITMFMEGKYHFSSRTIFNNLLGNVLAFMPLGFFLQLLFFKKKSIFRIFVISFITSSLVECIQYYFRIGGFDVDDILLNSIGGMFGSIVFLLLFSILSIRGSI
ncbi:VanZ family protein [Peribacillus sp. SCS-155]|uniref:VanZ family protein n=1 Tax=Peribacillus sedimenti TaxID=3115297 RepID=UPI0039060455